MQQHAEQLGYPEPNHRVHVENIFSKGSWQIWAISQKNERRKTYVISGML